MKFKLPKAKKNKWIKALRSGKYEQGSGQLCETMYNGDKYYCCLGVAKQIRLCQERKGSYNSLVSYNFIPAEIQSKLTDMNDSKMWSFKKIATWIEKNL
jgi:hypothetical protein